MIHYLLSTESEASEKRIPAPIFRLRVNMSQPQHTIDD